MVARSFGQKGFANEYKKRRGIEHWYQHIYGHRCCNCCPDFLGFQSFNWVGDSSWLFRLVLYHLPVGDWFLLISGYLAVPAVLCRVLAAELQSHLYTPVSIAWQTYHQAK
jgi:hypothetical protein